MRIAIIGGGPGGLYAAMPDLLAALGERLPTDREEFITPEAGAAEELILRCRPRHMHRRRRG